LYSVVLTVSVSCSVDNYLTIFRSEKTLTCMYAQAQSVAMNDSRRRDFLKVTGSVAVVGALAGCAGEAQEEDEEPEDEEAPDEPEPEEPEEDEEPQEEEEVEGDDLIRVAHMIPDFPDVDIYVDDTEEPVFEGIGYTDTTDYVELPEGEAQIRVTAADARSLVVFDEQVDVPAGNTTAVALGEPEEDEPADGQGDEGGEDVGFELELFEDDNTPPAESINDSRLRLIHASLDAPAVDVRVGETTVFENVSFGEGEYFDLPAGSYDFEVFPANGQEDEDPDEEEEEDENGILSAVAADGGSDISLLQQEEDDADEPAPDEEEEEDEELPEEEDEEEDEEDEELPEEEEEDEEDEEEDEEPVFTFSATTEENSVSTAFAVGYLDPEAVDSDEEFDVVLTEDVVDGEVVEQEDDD